jgi:hypothetical protein
MLLVMVLWLSSVGGDSEIGYVPIASLLLSGMQLGLRASFFISGFVNERVDNTSRAFTVLKTMVLPRMQIYKQDRYTYSRDKK